MVGFSDIHAIFSFVHRDVQISTHSAPDMMQFEQFLTYLYPIESTFVNSYINGKAQPRKAGRVPIENRKCSANLNFCFQTTNKN